MRQGNDVGPMYRSAIYTYTEEQLEAALKSKEDYQKVGMWELYTSLYIALGDV